MENLYLNHTSDGVQGDRHGSSMQTTATVRYKDVSSPKAKSEVAVSVRVVYRPGKKPLVSISGDTTCEWHIGHVYQAGERVSEKEQLGLFNPQV